MKKRNFITSQIDDGESSEASIKISENDHQQVNGVELGEKYIGARTTKDPNQCVNIKHQIKQMTMRGAQSALSNGGDKSNLRIRKALAK